MTQYRNMLSSWMYNMKLNITLIILILWNGLNAMWSSFAYVTPETEKEYKIEVYVSEIPKDTSKYLIKIKSPNMHNQKMAWLIISSGRIKKDDQIFRTSFWDGKIPEDVIVKTMLKPIEEDMLSDSYKQKDLKQQTFEIVLDKNMIANAYVYIDFSRVVKDGGYYYSIDLATYLNKMKQ